VFNNPENSKMLLVKRIRYIVNEGDTLHIKSDSVNPLKNRTEREHISSVFKNKVYCNDKKDSVYVVNQNLYFVEGDNYFHSKDSREFGYISERLLVGRFESVLFSIETTAKGKKRLRSNRFFNKIQ
jgi:signal peptidase I